MDEQEREAPDEEGRRRRVPRPVRGAAYGLGGLLALVLGILLLALLLVSTSPGLEVVRRIAEAVAGRVLTGTLEIGAIRGSALSELVIEDVVLTDAEGRRAVAVERLLLEWRPSALLNGAIVVERLALDRPEVLLVQTATGGLNLANLVPPSEDKKPPEPEEPGGPLPLSLPEIRLGVARIDRGALDFVSNGERLADVRALALELTGSADGQRIEARLSSLTAKVQDGLPLSLELAAVLDGERVEVDGLRLDLADGRVRVPTLETAIPPGPLEGEAQLSVPAELVRRLGGPSQLRADIDLDLVATRAEATPRWWARVDGRLGPSPLALSATVTESLDEVDVALDARAVDPSALWEGLPKGRLNLDVSSEGSVRPPDLAASVRVEGRIQPAPGQRAVAVSPLSVDAKWRGGTAEATAVGRVAGARLDLDVAADRLDLEGGLGGGRPPRVTRGRIDVEVPSLRDIAGPVATGQARLTAKVQGPIDRLTAAGTLAGKRLGVGKDVRIRAVDGRFDLKGLPATPDGTVRLEVAGVRLPDRRIKGVEVALRAKSERGAVDVRVPTLLVKTGPLVWRGGGARFSRSARGALALEDFELRSAAGALAASARVGPAGPNEGDLEATVRLADLELGKIPRSAAPELGRLQGRVRGDIQAKRTGGRTFAEVALGLAGFSLEPERPTIGAELHADLAPGKLSAQATVDGVARRFRLEAMAPAPTDATNPAGWRRALRAGPVRKLDLLVEALDLAKVQRLIGQPIAVAGAVDLSAEVERSGRRAVVKIDADELILEPARSKTRASAHLEARFSDARLVAAGAVDGKALGHGTFSATVAGPATLFETNAWTRLDETAIRGARLDIEPLHLGALAALGLPSGLAGRVSAHVEAREGVLPLTADVDAREVRLPWVEGVWATDLEARLTSSDAETKLLVELDEKGIIEARVTAPLAVQKLLQGKVDLASEVPLDARVELRSVPLDRVAKAGGINPEVIRGEVVADMTAEGPIDSLKAHVDLAIRRLAIAERKLEDFTVTATLAEKRFQGRARLAAPGAGGIVAEAKGRLTDEGPVLKGRLDGDGLPLRPLSRLGVVPVGVDGALFADLEVDVGPDTFDPQGFVEARDIRIVFAQQVLQPLYDGNLRVELNPKQAQLSLRAKSLGGSIMVEGQGDLGEAPLRTFAAQARLDDFPVNPGQLARVDMRANMNGQLLPEEGLILDVALREGFVTLPEDEATRKLHPISSPAEVEFVARLPRGRPKPAETATKAAGLPVVVRVDARDLITVRGGPVDARVDLDIESRTNVKERPGVRGRVWVPEGTVTLFERDYRIERAEVILEGREPPNPRLEVRLVHEFTEIGLEYIVRVSGTASEPKVDFSSNPARYSRPELLQIFLGTDPQELGQTDERPLEAKAAGAAVGFLAGQLQKEIGSALPLDTLDVDVTEQGVSNVTLGKWITREVFLAYRYNFESTQLENDSEAVVQWRFFPGWMVEAVVGLVRNDVDILWLTRFEDP